MELPLKMAEEPQEKKETRGRKPGGKNKQKPVVIKQIPGIESPERMVLLHCVDLMSDDECKALLNRVGIVCNVTLQECNNYPEESRELFRTSSQKIVNYLNSIINASQE